MRTELLRAAAEINELWATCLGRQDFQLAECPTNEQIAEIIENCLDHKDEE